MASRGTEPPPRGPDRAGCQAAEADAKRRLNRSAPVKSHTARAGYGTGALVGGRSSQQDTFLVEPLAHGALLAIVADGMGGHAEGALASKLAATKFRDAFVTAQAHGSALRAAFNEALGAANRAVDEAQRDYPEREGMGTTLLAAHLSAEGLAWISVGDSLLLVEQDGVLRRLNEDHSLRAVVGRGRESASKLRSAVTGTSIALIDCMADPVRLAVGDRVVVASDGLLTLSMDRVAGALAALRAGTAQQAADNILGLVDQVAAARQDNCTVLVLDSRSDAPIDVRRKPALSPTMLVALGLAAAAIVAFALFW